MENNWISVKDRLPIDGEEVLVYNVSMWVACIITYEQGNPIFIEPYSSHRIDNVTHWQPLPSPPNSNPN